MSDQHENRLSAAEEEEVEELAAPRAPVIYEVVRRQGEEELRRPAGSLFWSGIAGGMAIMLSVIGQGAVLYRLPPGLPWREAVSDFGYSLGFIIVVLGRMQLFTEQTIVAVLPLMAAPMWYRFAIVARLWAIVLVANMIGTLIAACIIVWCPIVDPPLLTAMLGVARHMLDGTPLDLLMRGVPAGFLIAAVAWIRAGTAGADFWIVLTLTSAIALGNFTHVVAGAAETFLLLVDGQVGVVHALGAIILPVMIGNIIGGTGLFALLAHAQVRQEL
ncbi:MAG TPA: formate/nitrite transporter family protein [Acetobacteraceae bacterium]|jgi:formate/nitrite transporter FocA (FNT family)